MILLVSAGCVNYLDRAAVAVAEPQIHQELALSYDQIGVLLSAFAWSYGLAQIPAGTLIDRFGPRRTLGLGLIFWSLAQIAATFVSSLGQFITARVALGGRVADVYRRVTCLHRLVCARSARLADRDLSIHRPARRLALAPPLLTWLMLSFGWRIMFFIAGLAGFAIAVLWAELTGLYTRQYTYSNGSNNQDLIDEPTNDGLPTITLKLEFPRLTGTTNLAILGGDTRQKMDMTFTGANIASTYNRQFVLQFPHLQLTNDDPADAAGIIKEPLEFNVYGASAAPARHDGDYRPPVDSGINQRSTNLPA